MTAQRTSPGNAASAGLRAEVSGFKRLRIREEACALFFMHGYESTTLDAVAQELQEIQAIQETSKQVKEIEKKSKRSKKSIN